MARSKSKSRQEYQFVWPRDRRPNGSKQRTFLQGLHDILTNRGPDMFVTKKHDKTPIPSEIWGNWDAYHSPEEAALDSRLSYKGPLGNADRGRKNLRYDPHSRKYVEWEYDNNWYDQGPIIPKYTLKEHEYLSRHPRRRLKGEDYSAGRPKRLAPEHQPFWHHARRIADNRHAGYMEETSNLPSDQYRMSFLDRAHGTPGLSRRRTLGVASKGRPDLYMGGPGVRRQLSPVWASYDARMDGRGCGADGCWEGKGDGLEGRYWDETMGGRGGYMW